ncbi:two component transcriptional regulator, winged helix family [Gloeothece citriformis PCC 7424]|uniref:Two component transcriptional regulator, winged helix family n=1 Tax=Gloeothece citriformis (strain PCC 7424) TaxID=65393 RepID=B7K6V4_GLOC7|nr:response regulator transcription factor [Gloeothece citriformis]ACK72653.1 two component transcriptional regulator, winged helix family [Gloeothece citriformis PCC 7424]
MRILLVEDEPGIAQFINQGLKETGYGVDLAIDGLEGKRYIESVEYDIIILDIMLPKIDGLTLLGEIRAKKNVTPVLLLTAKDSIEDRVKGLNGGADDYLVKPFAFSELLARIRALQRRPPLQFSTILQLEDLKMNLVTREVKRGDKIIDLSPLEFKLLEYLLRNANQVLTRTQIGEQVWDLDFYTNSNVVDVYIGYLRRKIDRGFDNQLLHTIRGVGYCLKPEGNEN